VRHTAKPILQIKPCVLAAADTPDEGLPVTGFLRWRSPDEKYIARLSLPAAASDEDVLPVEFLTADEREPASDLAGSTVALSGIAATVDEAATATFPVGKVREALRHDDDALVLQVGDPPVEWIPTE
ncbi:MAG: hypothetical protein D6741_11275, partial [Planctomycetota bacterium]